MMKYLCWFFFACNMMWAQEQKGIGQVMALLGSAKTGSRQLEHGSLIYVSDVIEIAEDSKLEIEFTDGGVFFLIGYAKYQVESYLFNNTDKSAYIASLFQGGMRAISGRIAKEEPDHYKIKTPVATIGVRGTLFMTNVLEEEGYFGVDSGLITVSNAAGTVVLEPGEYLSMTSANELGEISGLRPAALSLELFAQPPGWQSLESIEMDLNPPVFDGGSSDPSGSIMQDGIDGGDLPIQTPDSPDLDNDPKIDQMKQDTQPKPKGK